MTSLTTPGDIAGLVLLVAAITTVTARGLASWLAAARRAGVQQAEETGRLMHATARVLAQRTASVRAQRTASVPAQRAMPLTYAVVVPQQRSWQSRAGAPPGGQRSGLVEDRVPGAGPLDLEEAVSPGDQ
jgi:hypothetical protein